MTLREFLHEYDGHPQLKEISQWMQSKKRSLSVKGLFGSSAAVFLGSAQRQAGLKAVYILQDEDEAGYFYGDLVQCFGEQGICFFPSSYKHSSKPRQNQGRDSANQVLRTEALDALLQGSCTSLVTYPEAISEKAPDARLLQRETLKLSVGDNCGMDFVAETLAAFGFEQVDFVYCPGQYSLRGSLVDVFSYSNDLPYRIDFFGDDIDSIRTFDVESQLSVESKDKVSVVSAVATNDSGELSPVFDFMQDGTVVCVKGEKIVGEILDRISDGGETFLSSEDLAVCLKNFRVIEFGNPVAKQAVAFDEAPQPSFHKNFDLVGEDFAKRASEGYEVYVISDNPKQNERLREIFEDRNDKLRFVPVSGQLHEGFIDHVAKTCVYTDHQIFDRFHKYNLKSARTRAGKVVMSMKELLQMQVGDYVIHVNHGVGRFGGLMRMEVNGKVQEVIKIIYKDNDMIFVNVHSLHRISKYKSKDGTPPKLNKLGTAAWNNLKERTKKKVKDIARELIKLYAKRRSEKGFCFSPDSYLQQELESSFIYEDTPDQYKATLAVKHDMESDKPMDRLICGDVGFGKTEVAIRAAFKAATDGKQVAVLVPTTVLAFQHYKSFTRRLKRFPCEVEYLSRARKPSEVKDILERTAAGRVDILIGTHKLLGKDVKFKDLGLLIIDEEQKFGVAAKEKLRKIRSNIDTLTLTATPIPRTMQFSLMGARDLSIISTPPPNRYPVHTELIQFDDELIKEAIEFELARGGQVFFVNNHVGDLPGIETRLRKLVPKARICVGHGQMDSDKLEGILLDFIAGEYDILLCTSIIESGVDIPNVNTMFVNNAQHFGLSDLHQLRGRVGRTNKKAFCYLISPPLGALPPDARRRLQAIENFSDLGSGIHISMQDLDIRGAGNILGSEQSGFIADLGFETYHKILDEAVHELKYEEFSDVFADEIKAERENITSDCVFESDLEILLPASYVGSVSERIDLYRRLDMIKDPAKIKDFENEMTDRFGPMPPESKELLNVVRLRLLGMTLGLEKITIKNSRLTAYFPSDTDSTFYNSELFGSILAKVAEMSNRCRFRESQGKRMLVADNIPNVETAMDFVGRLAPK